MPQKIKNAFTLIELLVASGIAAVCITLALGTVGHIYFSQKKINVLQNFHIESRWLGERIVEFARKNTIDYDRYFVEVGPDPTKCAQFSAEQTPSGVAVANNNSDPAVNRANRAGLGYPTIFYWDTDGNNTQDRNLGGVNLDGNLDFCTQAFHGEQTKLYLIDKTRTLRTKIWEDEGKLMISREIGVDIDGDEIADEWTSDVEWVSGECRRISDSMPTIGDATEEFCLSAHDEVAISPTKIIVKSMKIILLPDVDPFLSFRVENSSRHPFVMISLETKLANSKQFGLSSAETPEFLLQTATSSRVFGDTRKE